MSQPPPNAPVAHKVNVVDDLGDCDNCGEYMGHIALLIQDNYGVKQKSYDWVCPFCTASTQPKGVSSHAK